MIFFIVSLSRSLPTYFGLKEAMMFCSNFLMFFAFFFLNFLLRVEYEHIRTNFFFSLLLTLSQPILAGKKTTMVFSNFWNFFCYFFLIFCYGSARNTSERYFFFSLFLGLCQRILSWKEAVMVFSIFFNFFLLFFCNFLLLVG